MCKTFASLFSISDHFFLTYYYLSAFDDAFVSLVDHILSSLHTSVADRPILIILRMSHFHVVAALLSCFLLFTQSGISQTQYGGAPLSQVYTELGDDIKAQSEFSFSKEYQKSEKKRSTQGSNILALPIIDKKLKSTSGLNQFTGYEKDRVWVNRISMPSQSESYLKLSSYDIPEGGRLFVIADDGKQVLGAYTRDNKNKQGTFLCGPIKGAFTIEYDSPETITKLPFQVEQIYAGATDQAAAETGFGSSFSCMININCDEGRPYEKEKRGVVRIRIVGEQGIALCTGALLNNTSADRTPYVLSAYHCERPVGIEFTPQHELWYFDFAYEAASCANPGEEPVPVSVQGAEKVSEYAETDMLLVKITGPMPIEANPYYNGWDARESYLPRSSTLIHHPSGDIKKISNDVDSSVVDIQDRTWDNGSITPSGSHIKAVFDNSTYQPGSSGAPLFDQDNRIVAQLHGGPPSDSFCTVAVAYCGRLSASWDSGSSPSERLKDWLDPDGTGVRSIEGIDAAAQSQLTNFKGRVVTADGIAISNVKVDISGNGDSGSSIFTGVDGRFLFDNLSTKGRFVLNLSKNTDPANGLTNRDIVMIRNHILDRKPLSNVYAQYAADVSQDGKVSNLDIIQMTNVLLGRWDSFPNCESWNFEPQVLEMSGQQLSSDTEFTIIGFKMGDVNLSSNPRK